eukprot:m.227746 g.227746  ORF g.227746 m.227746 type:complete len:604 (+) comp25953_c0_seq1:85-1896(+)
MEELQQPVGVVVAPPAASVAVDLGSVNDTGEANSPAHDGFGVQLELGDDGVIEVHPTACHDCDFEAEMQLLLQQLEEEEDDATGADEAEPAAAAWGTSVAGQLRHDGSADDWSPDVDSPLDRYPDAANLFDLADQMEEKTATSKRSSRPKKGQGGRSTVARADIPKKGKNSKSGGKVRHREMEKARAQRDKFMSRRAPLGGFWTDDGREQYSERPSGPDTLARWRLGRSSCQQRAADRVKRQPHLRSWEPYDPRDYSAGRTHSGSSSVYGGGGGGGAGPVLSAEELGMDKETWELLLQLQHRDIDPNDYGVLVELDNRIEKPSLEKRKLRLFPTAMVRACDGDGGTVTVVDSVEAVHIVSATMCSVCQEQFVENESVRKLPCGHLYHTECIDAWFEQSRKCPADQMEPQTPLEPPNGFIFGPDFEEATTVPIASAANPPAADAVSLVGGGPPAAAAAADIWVTKEQGDLLYTRVAKRNVARPGKVTGMLLELSAVAILELLVDDAELDAKIAEAVTVLDVHEAAAAPASPLAVDAAADDLVQSLGELLLPLVASRNDARAGKITGMLLELTVDEVQGLIDDSHKLDAKVDEAIAVLENFAAPE